MAEPLPPTAAIPGPTTEIHPVQTILRFLRAVRYRWSVVAVCAAVSVLLGGLYYFTTPRVYESRASLLVMQVRPEDWSTTMSGEKQARDLMATYRNMLSSEVVLEAAVAQLKPEEHPELKQAGRDSWAKVIAKHLSVSARRDTNILDVSYRSESPEAAAAAVASVLDAYQKFMDELHKSSAAEVHEIFTSQKAEHDRQETAKKAELAALNAEAGDVGIKDKEDGINVVDKRAISLNDAYIAARAQRLEAEAEWTAVDRAIREGADLRQFAVAMFDTAGQEMLRQRLGVGTTDAQTVSRVSQQLLEDRAKLQAESQLYGPANRRVLEIQQRIQSAEQFLQNWRALGQSQSDEISNEELAPLLYQAASQRYQRAKAHEEAIFTSYEEQKRRAIDAKRMSDKLVAVQDDLDRIKQYRDVIAQRIKDVNIGKDGNPIRMRELDKSEVAKGAVWPRVLPVGFLSMILGLGLGLAIVYLQELLDDHFRSPEELQLHLGVPVLAMVRRMETLADCGIEAVNVHMKPNAPEVEAFRTLRTALALAGDGAQRLVISSSEPGDGKTTVVVNLATVYAQSGKRTLLIDADMRRPGLTPLLDLRSEHGLSMVLRSDGPIGEAVAENMRPGMAENLDVLPSGPRPSNPTELLAGERFLEFLAWAEVHYDQILIDSPPAMVSDTAIIGRLVDGVLLVVQPQKNRRRGLIRAAESFPALGVDVLGVVVNHVTPENDKSYYGYGYGYGYGYSYGYGHDDDEDGDVQVEAGESSSVRPSSVRPSSVRPSPRPRREAA